MGFSTSGRWFRSCVHDNEEVFKRKGRDRGREGERKGRKMREGLRKEGGGRGIREKEGERERREGGN